MKTFLTASCFFALILCMICLGCGKNTAHETSLEQRAAPARLTATHAPTPTALSETELPAETGPYAGITETGEPPPDDYYDDPLFWIPGMKYETFHNTAYGNSSDPVWPPSEEIGHRIEARQKQLFKAYSREEIEDSDVTASVLRQAELEVISESMSPLHAAKYLYDFSSLYWDEAREFAQAALDANPDDFHTLLLWTTVQFDPFPDSYLEEKAWRERAVGGYRRLLEMNPNSARVMYDLGNRLSDYQEFEESIHLLETSAQLEPRFSEGAFLRIARKYYFFGDKVKALAYLKRLAEVASTQRARETTRERIEALEQHGKWLIFVD